MPARDAVIVSTARTPIGRAYRGAFNATPSPTLAAHAIRAAVERAKVDPAEIDDCIIGAALQQGVQTTIGRTAALRAGLPVTVAGMSIDRQCASGLMAIATAAKQVMVDRMPIVVAGGVESISLVQTPEMRLGPDLELLSMHNAVYMPMIDTAEVVGERYSVSRERCDEYALRSQQRTAAAQAEGRFADEIIPVTVKGRKSETVVDADEHIRADSSVEKLAGLRPVLGRDDPEATVTAGNASGQNDGAAICVVTHPARAEELGLRPLARLVSWGVGGVPPATMGIGPVPAVAKALGAAELSLPDMDLIELNEAFAAQVLACTREWKFTDADFERVNVNGSGISLGHPVGATGGRILATLVREMDRRDARYGLETMCIGGGQGLAAVFEWVA
jgi:acetyl-CoA C-acetyltransferase